MVRTQISLTEEQHRYLAEMAKQMGDSISGIIRRAVDRLRAETDTPKARALRLIGAFEADRHDVSWRHDELLWAAEPSPEPRKKRGKK